MRPSPAGKDHPRGQADQGEGHPCARPAGRPGGFKQPPDQSVRRGATHRGAGQLLRLLRLHDLSSGDCVGIGAVLQLGRGALARFRHATSAVAGRPSRAELLGCRLRTRAGTAVRGACGIQLNFRRGGESQCLGPSRDAPTVSGPWSLSPPLRRTGPVRSRLHAWVGRRGVHDSSFPRSPYSPEKRIQHVCTPRAATQPECGQGCPSRSTARRSAGPSGRPRARGPSSRCPSGRELWAEAAEPRQAPTLP